MPLKAEATDHHRSPGEQSRIKGEEMTQNMTAVDIYELIILYECISV